MLSEPRIYCKAKPVLPKNFRPLQHHFCTTFRQQIGQNSTYDQQEHPPLRHHFCTTFRHKIGQKFNTRPTRTSITSASVLHNFSVKIQPIWPAKNFRSAFTASLDTASSPELAPPNLQDRPSFTHPARSSPTTLLISQSEYSTCLGVCKQNT